MQAVARDDDRIALLPLVELALLAVGARIGARVPDAAIGHGLDEARATAVASVLDGLLRGCADSPDVQAVDGLGGNTEGLGPVLDVAGGRILHRRELAVEVVLADV